MSIFTLATAPHLITNSTDPIQERERHIVAHQDDIETRFRQQQSTRNSDNEISIGDFTPCAVLLNNDRSDRRLGQSSRRAGNQAHRVT